MTPPAGEVASGDLAGPPVTRFPAVWLLEYTGDTIRVVTVAGDYRYSAEGICFASDQTIAERLGLSRGCVNRAFASVEDVDRDGSGLVRSEYRPRTGTMERQVWRTPGKGSKVRAVCVSAQARDRLAGARFKVYCFLSLRQDVGETASVAQIAKGCAMQAATARTAAAELVADGWMSREAAEGGAYQYTVHPTRLVGVATQEALPFPQPRQNARTPRPELPTDADGLVAGTGLCPGQLPLVDADLLPAPPVVSVTTPPPVSVTAPPLVSVTQTSPLHEALLNKPLTVDGGCSRVAATSVPRDTPSRETSPATEDDLPVADGAGSPLRGEKPKTSSAQKVQEHPAPAASRQRSVVVPRPPTDLLRALAPVASLWERLDRTWARDRITSAARAELAFIAQWTGRQGADQALADRLEHRLRDQGGSALVKDPVSWMLDKGLPQRQDCAHGACDDGIRLDTGAECTTCEMRVADRRSTRKVVVGQVVAQMPGADPQELRSAIDERLHRHAMLRAEQQVAARELAEQQRVQTEARNAVRQAEAEAAEAARQALSCEDCGAERAAGLCAGCWSVRATRTGISEAVDLALAGSADLTDRADVNAIVHQVRGELREEMLRARPAGTDLSGIRASDLLTVQNAVAEYRASALVLLARSPQADAEAKQAFEAAVRRRHLTDDSPQEAAEQARQNTARHLLVSRLEAVQALRQRARQAQAAAPAREAVSA